MALEFDEAVRKILPTIAEEHGLNPEDVRGHGLDPNTYVGDKGGALWKGLCKGDNVKSKTIFDTFYVKQDTITIQNILLKQLTRRNSRV